MRVLYRFVEADLSSLANVFNKEIFPILNRQACELILVVLGHFPKLLVSLCHDLLQERVQVLEGKTNEVENSDNFLLYGTMAKIISSNLLDSSDFFFGEVINKKPAYDWRKPICGQPLQDQEFHNIGKDIVCSLIKLMQYYANNMAKNGVKEVVGFNFPLASTSLLPYVTVNMYLHSALETLHPSHEHFNKVLKPDQKSTLEAEVNNLNSSLLNLALLEMSTFTNHPAAFRPAIYSRSITSKLLFPFIQLQLNKKLFDPAMVPRLLELYGSVRAFRESTKDHLCGSTLIEMDLELTALESLLFKHISMVLFFT